MKMSLLLMIVATGLYSHNFAVAQTGEKQSLSTQLCEMFMMDTQASLDKAKQLKSKSELKIESLLEKYNAFSLDENSNVYISDVDIINFNKWILEIHNLLYAGYAYSVMAQDQLNRYYQCSPEEMDQLTEEKNAESIAIMDDFSRSNNELIPLAQEFMVYEFRTIDRVITEDN